MAKYPANMCTYLPIQVQISYPRGRYPQKSACRPSEMYNHQTPTCGAIQENPLCQIRLMDLYQGFICAFSSDMATSTSIYKEEKGTLLW